MIFDADKGNINLPQSAFQKKQGELISPSIDLSNDTNVTLIFTHMYIATPLNVYSQTSFVMLVDLNFHCIQ